MSTGIDYQPEQSTAALLTGILSDLQLLVEQQLRLTRREILDDLQQRGLAASMLMLGVGVLFIDAIVASLTLAHLLHWITSPALTDPASVPLWACYGIMVVILTVVGCVLIQTGKVRFTTQSARQNKTIETQQE